MNIADELSIPGRIETVYANLVDPEVLKRCIPSCQELKTRIPIMQRRLFWKLVQ